MATSRLRSSLKLRFEIPATSTLTVDKVSLAKFRELRYFVSCWNSDNTKSMDMRVMNNDSQLSDTVFGRVGSLPLSIGAVVNGTDGELRITNPNATAMQVELQRFRLGRS